MSSLTDSDPLDARIIELYVEARWSQRKVAALLGIGPERVRSRLRANDIHIRTRKENGGGYGANSEYREIARTVFLYQQCRMSQRDVARCLGIGYSTVNYRLRAVAGVQSRTMSEALSLYQQRRRENGQATDLRGIEAA